VFFAYGSIKKTPAILPGKPRAISVSRKELAILSEMRLALGARNVSV
jgi:hypothetical protein